MTLMRPYDYDPKHLVLPCYISAKLDGVRCYDDGSRFSFRSGNPIWGVDDLYLYAGKLGLDGEMLIPGVPFNESSGQIRSYNPSPKAVLYVFDYTTGFLGYKDRYKILLKAKFATDRIKIVKHTLVHTIEEMMTIHNQHLDAGFEGSVIKTPNHVYQHKKSWDWMRIVPIMSADVRVVSMYEGQGKYVGMMGGVMCQGDGIEVKVGTGFDDFQRQDFWVHPAKILDHVIRVTYKEKTKDGSLRHPSFDRIRYNK